MELSRISLVMVLVGIIIGLLILLLQRWVSASSGIFVKDIEVEL